MKNIFKTIILVAAATFMASCSKDNSGDVLGPIFNATVTFRPMADGTFFIKQDDSTALLYASGDMSKYPFKEVKEQRAFIQYELVENPETKLPMPSADGIRYANYIKLLAYEPIQTKAPVAFESGKEYGHDPIALYLGDKVFPSTIIEDGYLNLSFAVSASTPGVMHEINVVYGANSEDPYELEIHHNMNGAVSYGYTTSHVMNFPLKNLPDTEGKTVKLTLKWYSLIKGETVTETLDYCSRKDW